MEIISQLQMMNDSKYYLHLIEDIKRKYQKKEEIEEQEEQQQSQPITSKNVGSVGGGTISIDGYEEPLDEFESKLGGSIVVAVHDTPRVPTGFKKSKKKKKGSIMGEAQITSQELDAEYFAFQEEQQAFAEKNKTDVEKEEKGIKETFRKFGFGNKKE